MSDPLTPPQHDVAELTVFGPGYGECLVVHLGAGEWMIVDSCVSADHQLPSLNYLSAMGVDTATAVKLIVATHWHDDHVKGLSRIMAQCLGTRFVCSAALQVDELLKGVGSARPEDDFLSVKTSSGVDEMRKTFNLLGGASARWAIEGRLLYERQDAPGCRITALSPSDDVLTRAQRSIRDLVMADQKVVVPRPDRNLSAVVLWVEVGDTAMLLGADLQEAPKSHSGWTTILGCGSRPYGRAEVFKVPHHGSENGHHDSVYDEMLVPDPETVVCPCSNGSTDLPTDRDIERLCRLSRAHLTATSRSDFVRRNGRRRRPVVAEFGRVTLRRPLGSAGKWAADYVSPAHCPC